MLTWTLCRVNCVSKQQLQTPPESWGVQAEISFQHISVQLPTFIPGEFREVQLPWEQQACRDGNEETIWPPLLKNIKYSRHPNCAVGWAQLPLSTWCKNLPESFAVSYSKMCSTWNVTAKLSQQNHTLPITLTASCCEILMCQVFSRK